MRVVRGTIVESDETATYVRVPGGITRICTSRITRAELPSPSIWRRATPPNMVFVVLDGSALVLQQRDSCDEMRWVDACVAPCNVLLPRNNWYRVNGSGIRRSAGFMLRAHGGTGTVLSVETQSRARFIGGWVAVSLGVTFFSVGMPLTSIGAASSNCSSCVAFLAAGAPNLIAALASFIVAAVLMNNSSPSIVTQDPLNPK